eukprot:TRINITY_DN4149_c0_g2_i1.p2 TRINITY_DN4149_c0_g2~~TRINITY_DN4149_c0_g2_i1.p2  ORF type:complete len:237 (-),score=54.85 TRINITY_DN4149_c0_g2_i1:1088-1768(-)
MSSAEQLISAAREFAKQHLSGYDASHDFWHAERVARSALNIAQQEQALTSTPIDIVAVELAAYLHDVGDWKYSGSDEAGPRAVLAFLRENHCDDELAQRVVRIIDNVSFHKELSTKSEIFPELAIVQDADRLDALGAIGIARTFSYGARKNTPMHVPGLKPTTQMTTQEYMQRDQSQTSTVLHFYEKLLLLKDMMKTATGRKLAEGRHKYMELYLQQLYAEWDGVQ